MTFAHRIAAAFTVGLFLLAGPALAQGKLEFAGKFDNGATEVDLATYTSPNDKGVEERVGLLGLRVGTTRNSVAFGQQEWRALLDLWAKAQTMQSNDWAYAGDFTETGTSDVSHLKVFAGPGVRFIVESPAKGAFTVDLKRADMPAFDTALIQVKTYLGAP